MPPPLNPTVHQEVCNDLLNLIRRLQTEREGFDARYQDIVAKFYHAQAAYTQSVQQCTRLRQVVQVKQSVIQVLLPYYPHPITPELRYQIEC